MFSNRIPHQFITSFHSTRANICTVLYSCQPCPTPIVLFN
uniref:Uncharacterized protein n=1 Tax=Arundo donax TaxID=35708 RepID=A0A0A8ZUV1_ARUDO